MLNKYPYTNPGAITNSGNTYFTNPSSKIYKLNLNLVTNFDEYNDFLVEEFKQRAIAKNFNQNKSNATTSNDFTTILKNQRSNGKLNKLN
jgi:hypothetical protein